MYILFLVILALSLLCSIFTLMDYYEYFKHIDSRRLRDGYDIAFETVLSVLFCAFTTWLYYQGKN
jgi:hypothetical protein